MAFSALYCLGCGATLFAGEQDADTYEFQRTLPAAVGQVFWGKATFALASGAAMFGLTWLLAVALSGWKVPAEHDHLVLWGVPGFYGLELFLWATMFSLLLKRPLLAAVLGVTTVSLVDNLLAWAPMGSPPAVTTIDMYYAALPWARQSQ